MRPKILLIDDSAMLRRIVASVLQAQPARYEVVAATRASEGFAHACAGDLRLVLMDYRLAGADRLDFCRRLLDEPRAARLPVVLLVGRGMPVPPAGDRPENVVETLAKPFAPEHLAGLVNTLLGGVRTGLGWRELRARSGSANPFRATAPTLAVPFAEAPGTAAAAPEKFRVREQTAAEPIKEAGSRAAPGAVSPWTSLRQAAEQRATGLLRLGRPGQEATVVYLEEGRLLAVSTRDAQAYGEGAADLLPAKVSPATLAAALEEQARTGVPFLLALGARGLLPKAAAEALVQRFGQRQFARAWAWQRRGLDAAFEPLEHLPGFALRLEGTRQPLEAWFFDALRLLRSADVTADARHEGCYGTPVYRPGGEARLAGFALTAPELGFTRRVNGRTDLPSLARAGSGSAEDLYLLLCRFRGLEIMDYRPAPAPFVMTPRTNLRRVLPLAR